MSQHRLHTIGHSTHEVEDFLALLRQHDITAVADVRSSPYSRIAPQHNREFVAEVLKRAKIQYVYLGQELGARRDEPECYDGNRVSYPLVAQSPLFRHGLDRVRRGLQSFRIALLCAEKDPLTCHRTILVCRQLREDCGPIGHILADGTIESHDELEARLLAECDLATADLFLSRAQRIDQAYDTIGARIAYTDPENEG